MLIFAGISCLYSVGSWLRKEMMRLFYHVCEYLPRPLSAGVCFMASSLLTLPPPLRAFFALFPLHTYPSQDSSYATTRITEPTLWVHAPRTPEDSELDLLSADVECLKWQAYLALRNVRNVAVRWDVSPDGGVDGRLPALHVPLSTEPGAQDKLDDGEGELLAPHLIPGWVDARVGQVDALEGYMDFAARDESRAWVALMEGTVHAALVRPFCCIHMNTCRLKPDTAMKEFFQPKELTLRSMLAPYSTNHRPVETMLNPPPAPLTGFASFIPPYGVHLDRSVLELQYKEAIAALSERLSTDKWFLGSEYILSAHRRRHKTNRYTVHRRHSTRSCLRICTAYCARRKVYYASRSPAASIL